MSDHITLLNRVAEVGTQARIFEGRLLPSGKAVDTDELPNPALLLECATPKGARLRGSVLWVLWKLDREHGEWIEVVRTQSVDRSWVEAIQPTALRLLRGPVPIFPEIPEVKRRILSALDNELASMTVDLQMELLFALDPEIAGRIAAHL